MIPPSISDEFRVSVRKEGLLHRVRGAVSVIRNDAGGFGARVKASPPGDVLLSFGEGSLAVACSCPSYVRNGPCSHIWATLLEAEARGALRASRDRRIGDGVAPRAFPAIAEDAPPPRTSHWREAIASFDLDAIRGSALRREELPPGHEIAWAIDVPACRDRDALILTALTRRPLKNGDWTRPVELLLTRNAIVSLPDADDRFALQLLEGALSGRDYSVSQTESSVIVPSWRLGGSAHAQLVARLAATGRLFVDTGGGPLAGPASWDEPPWEVVLEMREAPRGWTLHALLQRGDERFEADSLVLAGHLFAVLPDFRIAPIGRGARWLIRERTQGAIHVPESQGLEAAAALLSRADTTSVILPDELALETITVPPRPLFDMGEPIARQGNLAATLEFDYDGDVVRSDHRSERLVDAARRRIILRDADGERAARALLGQHGVQPARDQPGSWAVPVARMPAITAGLLKAGWRVTARGIKYRSPATPRVSVTTGIDWFEVRGTVEFDDLHVDLPAILRASRAGDLVIQLGDGTLGMLPQDWLARNARWLSLGDAKRDHVRFRPTQAALLDAFLAGLPEATCDETFVTIRSRLHAFEGIAPAPQPAGFVGTLRDYQRIGVGWMSFLRDFGLGGCLADDMGVGKTAQVLAMLESRRASVKKAERRPSLVVVPRSLVFNWMEEASRFTPKLKVVDLSGPRRDLESLRKAHVGLLTYGTLRRVAPELKDLELDYAILDEAQAIKNRSSASAKAALLLNARHRLVMTGTPVENHLGELWSLFEFLNPGMLGAASVFHPVKGARQELGDEDRALLSRALRPFLLRRTKQQVAKELPARTEQTIHCRMSAEQRAAYSEAREHYRAELLGRIDEVGMGEATFFVLEALLRLRQLACHPGLVDPARRGEPSAKLDTLLEQLEQVIEEGHKVLVFSQFTSFLAIVKERLDALGIVYEYLDGATTDRAARVARFQTDDSCRTFLISLKAGGVGLNLTAADYVFLLDPWWNPAVEAQAIDRAHRIGQSRKVFAYRLICAGTVEEHVLELQQRKRALADALFGDAAGLAGRLTRADVELLLS